MTERLGELTLYDVQDLLEAAIRGPSPAEDEDLPGDGDAPRGTPETRADG
ncbi:MAG: hypothetical protein GWO00_15775 [Gemmatimonadetes bacterium]|nr:hypothetical protein [Gemmatimonadota bacterium]NIR79765.1 hypothetical protein [Gemmatimonadota bacterium]NIT88461.1 hypothetical protein [Gemmatimonadota bacterium]NIU32284.1 hypothetical protein [Gemmatimonadota bacterium]NIV62656.1 hypothetical protein [Gemmatimonadota bacterium]